MIKTEIRERYPLWAKNGGFLFAAQVGSTDGSSLAGESMYEQTVQALKNLQGILNTENADLSDIIKCDIYVTDMNEYKEFCRAYNSVMPQPYPLRKCTEVHTLKHNAKIQIDVMAYIGKN